MAILGSEIKKYKSETVNDSGTNGGKRSYTEADFNTLAGVVPNITVAERSSGVTKYTKIFYRLENSNDEEAINPFVGLSGYDSGDDSFYILVGDYDDVQSDVSGLADSSWFGGAILDANITATDTTFDVSAEQTTVGINDTEKFLVTDGVNSEIITANGVSWAGLVATITLDATAHPTGFANSYTVGSCDVIPLVSMSDVTTSWSQVANPNSLTITGDVATTNNGTIYEDYIATFVTSTTYTLARVDTPSLKFTASTGAESATSYDTFNVASAYSIQNANETTGRYLFSIPSGFFSGASAGNTYTFRTTPAEVPVWIKRVVPAGATAGSVSNTLAFMFEGV